MNQLYMIYTYSSLSTVKRLQWSRVSRVKAVLFGQRTTDVKMVLKRILGK